MHIASTRAELRSRTGVPFYVYVPDALRPAGVDRKTCATHIDIMPTLYNLSLSEQEYVSVGVDMLDASLPHVAFTVDGFAMSQEGAVRSSLENNMVA